MDLGGDELSVEAVAAGAPGVAAVSDDNGDGVHSGASGVADVSDGNGTVVRAPDVSPDAGARDDGSGGGMLLSVVLLFVYFANSCPTFMLCLIKRKLKSNPLLGPKR